MQKKIRIWRILTIVFGLLLITSIFTDNFGITGLAVNSNTVAKNAIDYINTVLLQGQATAKLVSMKSENGLYNLKIDINGKVVGGLGLMNKEKNHKAEIGYWLGKKYWNKGIMTKAVKLMTDFGFKKLKLKRVYATVFPKNKASVRILEKSNYKLEGLMSKHHKKNGKYFDALLYARIK